MQRSRNEIGGGCDLTQSPGVVFLASDLETGHCQLILICMLCTQVTAFVLIAAAEREHSLSASLSFHDVRIL